MKCLTYSVLLNKKSQSTFENFQFRRDTIVRDTRASKDILILPICRTEVFKCSFCYSAAAFWNNLPSNIRATCLANFKHNYFLLGNDFRFQLYMVFLQLDHRMFKVHKHIFIFSCLHEQMYTLILIFLFLSFFIFFSFVFFCFCKYLFSDIFMCYKFFLCILLT